MKYILLLIAFLLFFQTQAQDKFPVIKKKIALYDSVQVLFPEDDPKYDYFQKVAKKLTTQYQHILISYQQEHDFTFVKQFVINGGEADWAIEVQFTVGSSPLHNRPVYDVKVQYFNPQGVFSPMLWSIDWAQIAGENEMETMANLQKNIGSLNQIAAGSFVTSRVESPANQSDYSHTIAINNSITGVDEAYCMYLTQLMSNAAITYQKGYKTGFVHLIPVENYRFNVSKGFIGEQNLDADAFLFGRLNYDANTDLYTLKLHLKKKNGEEIVLLPPFQQEVVFEGKNRYSYAHVLHHIKTITDGLIYHYKPNEE